MKQQLKLLIASLVLAFILCGAVSAADDAYVTNQGGNSVSVINTTTNTQTTTIPVGPVTTGVAVSPDGTTAYVTNYGSNYVSVINTTTNTVTTTIPVGNNPYGVAFSPGGTTAYVANHGSDHVSVINTATNTVTTTIPVGNGPSFVAFSPDGTTAYVTNEYDDSVSVINTATNIQTTNIPVGSQPQGIAFSPGGTTAYIANYGSDHVSVINTATNTVTTNIPVGSQPQGIAVSPDGTTAYVTIRGNNYVSVIDTATNTVTTTIPVGSSPIGVAFSPDGTTAYVANYGSNYVSVIDTATNTVTTTIPVGSSPIGVAITSNGITYTITPSAGTGGTIDPDEPQTVNHGDDRTFTITPNTGYVIADVAVDGISQGPINSYTFTNVQSNHEIAATFNRITYTITPSAGTGGTIDPDEPQTVNHGDDRTFTITPNTGYVIADVTVDGISQGPINSYTFTNVQSNHEIAATFNRITYTITSSAGTGGTIDPLGQQTVNHGDSQTFNIEADAGWQIADVTVDGASVGAEDSYTFTNVQRNHEIAATFIPVPQADLYINSWSSKSNPLVGEIYTLTFKLGNRGPNTAENVVFTLPLPDGVEFVDVNVDQGTARYDPATRAVTWTLGDVVVGDPYAWVRVRALNVGSFIFRPTLTTDTDDPNIESNIQTVTVNVQAAGEPSETVHAQTVGMQETGAPIVPLALAILSIFGGIVSSRKNK